MINTCGIFLFNKQNKFLICRPTGVKTDINWSIPKGKQEQNELLIDSAIRETFEETSIDLKSYKDSIIHIGQKNYSSKKKRFVGFILTIDTIPPCKCICKVGDRFPEIDKYELVDIPIGIDRIHYTQSSVLRDYLNGI